jgi:hypothetical protein
MILTKPSSAWRVRLSCFLVCRVRDSSLTHLHVILSMGDYIMPISSPIYTLKFAGCHLVDIQMFTHIADSLTMPLVCSMHLKIESLAPLTPTASVEGI